LEKHIPMSAVSSSSQLKKGDLFFCEAGDIIPWMVKLLKVWLLLMKVPLPEKVAPVIREAGGDKSSVTGGTKVLSDKIQVK
jgi:K+-transporting ATPase ATPase B chain